MLGIPCDFRVLTFLRYRSKIIILKYAERFQIFICKPIIGFEFRKVNPVKFCNFFHLLTKISIELKFTQNGWKYTHIWSKKMEKFDWKKWKREKSMKIRTKNKKILSAKINIDYYPNLLRNRNKSIFNNRKIDLVLLNFVL